MLASCAPRSQPARAALTQDTVLGAGEAELRGPWRCARTAGRSLSPAPSGPAVPSAPSWEKGRDRLNELSHFLQNQLCQQPGAEPGTELTQQGG